jgi:4-hydroxy-4-methyl-2-oxoglutarate aldolase
MAGFLSGSGSSIVEIPHTDNRAQKMPATDRPAITFEQMRKHFTAAVVCDALDAEGFTRQSPRVPLRPLTVEGVLIGRCKTTLWAEMAHPDPRPYELELAAVDSCTPDDVLICAAGGSLRSGIWGELLSTAARNRGCVGVIADGAVRDLARMKQMGFSVFARAPIIYDSKDRQRVIDFDVPVEIDGVVFSPGDLVVADDDGIVVGKSRRRERGPRCHRGRDARGGRLPQIRRPVMGLRC